jgi:hypothetical protein
MQDEIKVWLEDIEKAIAEIDAFLPEPRNFLEFEKDRRTTRERETKSRHPPFSTCRLYVIFFLMQGVLGRTDTFENHKN